jgi:hypothetical protein
MLRFVNIRLCLSGPARIANLGGKIQIVEFERYVEGGASGRLLCLVLVQRAAVESYPVEDGVAYGSEKWVAGRIIKMHRVRVESFACIDDLHQRRSSGPVPVTSVGDVVE